MGPTGDLLRGPHALPGKATHAPAEKRIRGAIAGTDLLGSQAQAEARHSLSGFEGIESENVASAHAGHVRMTRVQSETGHANGSTYTGTSNENVIGGRMAAVAATTHARAQSIAGGRPINSRYGRMHQTASVRMMAGVPLSTKFPVAVAGSGALHAAAVSGDGGRTGVVASTPLVQSISKAG
jgi:hypothetical protein